MKNSKLHGDNVLELVSTYVLSPLLLFVLYFLESLNKDYVIQGLSTMKPRTQ